MKFEIFKTGTHTSDKGLTKEYSLDDLNFIAQSYNPSEDEAPIVIGHPLDNSPAYGWISSLEVTEDGKLVADAPDDKLHPDFLNAVQEGRYKKRSISLTPDGKLRHVGFLGGAAPAVKGLADIQFSQPSSTVIEFELDEQSMKSKQSEDPDLSGQLNSDISLLDNITNQLNSINETIKQLNNNFSESQNNDLTVKFNQLSTEINSLKSKLNKSEFESLLENKLGEGSLTPAIKDKLLAVSNFAEAQNFSADFSQDKFNKELNHLLTDLVNSFPKVIYYENFAEKPEFESDKLTDEFSEYSIDSEAKALHSKALALSKKENITYLNAVKKLSVSNH
jgi:TolA-binding protein